MNPSEWHGYCLFVWLFSLLSHSLTHGLSLSPPPLFLYLCVSFFCSCHLLIWLCGIIGLISVACANAYFHFYYNHTIRIFHGFPIANGIRTCSHFTRIYVISMYLNHIKAECTIFYCYFVYLIGCHFTCTPFLVITFETNKMVIKHWSDSTASYSNKAMNQWTTSRSFLYIIKERK